MPVADWNKIAYGNGLYIAVSDGAGADGKVVVSSSPQSGWVIKTIPAGYGADICFDNGIFALVGRSGALITADGENFTAKNLPAATYRTVASHEGRIVALGGKCIVSTDGLDTWEEIEVPRGGWDALEFGGGFFAAVGGGSAYMVAAAEAGGFSVPLVWDEREKLNYALLGVAFGADVFVGVGDGIQVAGIIDVRAALAAAESPSASNPFMTAADCENISADAAAEAGDAIAAAKAELEEKITEARSAAETTAADALTEAKGELETAIGSAQSAAEETAAGALATARGELEAAIGAARSAAEETAAGALAGAVATLNEAVAGAQSAAEATAAAALLAARGDITGEIATAVGGLGETLGLLNTALGAISEGIESLAERVGAIETALADSEDTLEGGEP
jgi:hypothetical protein